jgi:hypothetical protein
MSRQQRYRPIVAGFFDRNSNVWDYQPMGAFN